MRAVRGQLLYLGRLLPLGGPGDGSWITEQAAVRTLWRTAAEVPGIWLETMRIGLAPHDPVSDPAVRPPAGALPPGPLKIEASFSASAAQPLRQAAEQLRSTLLSAAAERLGLTTVAADLRVMDLREGTETAVKSRTARKATMPPSEAALARSSAPATGTEPLRGPLGEVAGIAMAVPGVARLSAVVGSRPVRVEDRDDPPGRHIEVQLVVAPGHQPLKVVGAVRAAVTDAAISDTQGPVTVAILVTEIAALGAMTGPVGISASRPQAARVPNVVGDRHADEAFRCRGPFVLGRAVAPCDQPFASRARVAAEQGY